MAFLGDGLPGEPKARREGCGWAVGGRHGGRVMSDESSRSSSSSRWIHSRVLDRTCTYVQNCRLYVLQNFAFVMPSRAISSKADAFFLGFLFRSRFIGLNPFFASPCGSKPTFFLLLSIKLVEASPMPLRDYGDLLVGTY